MKTPGNRSKPLYQHVADDIVAKIECGFWQPGSKLPSERALCDQYSVSQITVRRALRELTHLGRVYSHHGLGWFVNKEQQGDATHQVTFILPDLDWATRCMLRALIDGLDAGRTALRLAFTDGNPQNEAQELQRAIARGVDGILLAVAGEERTLTAHYSSLLRDVSVPVLLLWHEVKDVNYPSVIVDEGVCMQTMTRHLLDLGHQRIAYAGSNPALVAGQRRYWGFATTLWEHGIDLPLSWVLASELNTEAETRRLQQIFQGAERPTALVCASDDYAAKAMAILQRLELRCPEDVAVVGLGDRDFAPLLPVPLTTFRYDLAKMGAVAAEMTLELLAGRPVKDVRLSGQVITRSSCGTSYPRALR
ncbi:MAG: GntR family transcriptional regulator [Chloroflexi bacterium]|nr:GntR family transcriptional regulator [Chloroflexota bacterium]